MDSAPRITVHVVPETFVTAIISDGALGSATWNWETPVAAAPNMAEDATVHVSCVPCAGASVPPEVTVVVARFAAKSSVAIGLPQSAGWMTAGGSG